MVQNQAQKALRVGICPLLIALNAEFSRRIEVGAVAEEMATLFLDLEGRFRPFRNHPAFLLAQSRVKVKDKGVLVDA
jgi:hypothetical protein